MSLFAPFVNWEVDRHPPHIVLSYPGQNSHHQNAYVIRWPPLIQLYSPFQYSIGHSLGIPFLTSQEVGDKLSHIQPLSVALPGSQHSVGEND